MPEAGQKNHQILNLTHGVEGEAETEKDLWVDRWKDNVGECRKGENEN